MEILLIYTTTHALIGVGCANDIYMYQKVTLPYSGDFVVSPVSRHFPFSMDFAVSPVFRHFPHSWYFAVSPVSIHFPIT